MEYKLFFTAIMCNRLCGKFMKMCDLGVEDVGVEVDMSFTTTTEPTKEYINKIILVLESTKYYKELEKYFANVKLDRIEVVSNELN